VTQVPIAEAILHPPLGAITRELISGTFSGSGDLTRATGAFPPFNNVNAYGLTWDFFTVPAAFGSTLGSPVIYENRMLQLSTVHTGFDGHDLISEFHGFQSEGIYWLWENPGPTRIHYEIQVGVAVVFFWLIVRFP
jgi:hypothetical protein